MNLVPFGQHLATRDVDQDSPGQSNSRPHDGPDLAQNVNLSRRINVIWVVRSQIKNLRSWLIRATRRQPPSNRAEQYHAPCWRAREAWDCSARIRSASVPPPPSEALPWAGAPLPVAPLDGFAATAGSAASVASIGEFGPSSCIASLATSAAISLIRCRSSAFC